ncbi:beta-tubulin cofactor d [Xylariaceae sp. FL1019]|nr:beta-tubulin cofactor d [Xylariaceae sp. FL1019]
MDASERERDVFIQKHATDFIADFDRSLGPFLRKPNGQLRRRVRFRETTRLISQLLEHFQELPQLLDPHLPKWLPALADAYLECLQDRRKLRGLSTRSQLLHPLPNAICRIIYSFCKIRGEKVIVRFLSVETRYLELLLQAIEGSEHESSPAAQSDPANSWTWHERYIVLLWLSQLFFAPFDLSTISSNGIDEFDQPIIRGFEWPQQIPRITLRVMPLAIRYLASPGKERDGAKALLVRLAMRRDMQELKVLSALVQWAVSTLQPSEDSSNVSPYYFIGSLSFLAGVLRAAEDTSIMNNHLETIFYAVQNISSGGDDTSKLINGSALARKMMIKVTRSLVLSILRKSRPSMGDTEIVETTIGYLLEHLADNDTPVRFAASKALSIITLKLDSEMASQVIEAVVESLNRNVLWIKSKGSPASLATRDLTAVDPLEWHGLMLTLSHLLYRRSPPPENLSVIIHSLLIGLSFEKRSPSGGSVGSNVRDASCFGIWALARRYSTAELLAVQTQSILVARGHHPTASILQVIATELVVNASIDPAGNIRRGASAALQELIGRHPDTIEKGISVVQVVDYHAVALRSRAIQEVALQATRLSPHYGRALLEGTLGWRGIGDMEADARRVAAVSYGTLAAEIARSNSSNPLEDVKLSIDLLLSRISGLQVRQVEERHGLLLSLAAVLDLVPSLIGTQTLEDISKQLSISQLQNSLQTIFQHSSEAKFRKPELIAEATSTLVVSAVPLFLANLFKVTQEHHRLEELVLKGSDLIQEKNSKLMETCASRIDDAREQQVSLPGALLRSVETCVNIWLDRSESSVVRLSSAAAMVLLLFSSPTQRIQILKSWCEKIRLPPTPRTKHGDGFLHALCGSYSLFNSSAVNADHKSTSGMVIGALVERWSKDTNVETHVAIIQSFTGTVMLRNRPADFIELISAGLEDYTITARGDIGSHVRLQAIKATKTLWLSYDFSQQFNGKLFAQILRLSAEKLDSVRAEAKSALEVVLSPKYREIIGNLSFSSKEYFGFLLALRDMTAIHPTFITTLTPESCISSLLAGLVTSADTGNEDLVIATRASLAELCGTSDNSLLQVCTALLCNLKLHAMQDRVLIPTLEVIAYLFHVGILQRCCTTTGEANGQLNLRQLSLLVQKAAYKTGNVRKLEACIKVYGAIASIGDSEAAGEASEGLASGIREARKRLGALLLHPWPRVRNLVVDELWCIEASFDYEGKSNQDVGECSDNGPEQAKMLLGIDWGRASKVDVQGLISWLS